MAITYGFYNSFNGDRRYDAIQVSSLFDGIIGDGVFETIGDALMVELTSGLSFKVGTGRAWFNHTWTLNDSDLAFTLNPADVTKTRIDAVYLEVNEEARSNNIRVLTGTPATSNAQRPALTKTAKIHQYPLAYITVTPGLTKLTAANVANMVGTTECPFVIGVVKTMTIDHFVSAWSVEWNQWLASQKKDYDNWMVNSKADFNKWFEGLKVTLDGNVAANLANQIQTLNTKLELLLDGKSITSDLLDSTGGKVMDSTGGEVLASRYVNVQCPCTKKG